MSSQDREFGETTMEWFQAAEHKDQVRSVTMSKKAAEWFECMVDHGLFVVDPLGKTYITPGARELVTALNAVLAGGKVEVEVVSPGDSKSRERLDGKLREILQR
jgi:hypothetical protein